MNEILEFARIMVYVLIVYGLILSGLSSKDFRLAFYGIAFHFSVRVFLLLSQINSPDTYRELNNMVSTPSSVIALFLLCINLYRLRRY